MLDQEYEELDWEEWIEKYIVWPEQEGILEEYSANCANLRQNRD
jgi:hypothetical protein